MKNAHIIYFDDKTAVVVIATDSYCALGQLDHDQLSKVTRVDVVPYPVL